MRKYLHVWHISFDRRRVEMLLESFRGEQIKNAAAAPHTTLYSPHSLSNQSKPYPTHTKANRCSAPAFTLVKLIMLKRCRCFSFWSCCCPFKWLCKVAWNGWVGTVEKCCIDTCGILVCCGGKGQRAARVPSIGPMINARQLTIQGKSCSTSAAYLILFL